MKHGHLERPWQDGYTSGGTVEQLAEFTSPSGEYKAVIARASDSAIRVCTFRHFYDEAVDECYWLQQSAPILTDTLEAATVLAKEQLAETSGE